MSFFCDNYLPIWLVELSFNSRITIELQWYQKLKRSFRGNTIYNLNSMVTLKLKLNSINGQIIATFLLYSSFLLYFSFSFQAWDSICFYCCWCLTLLDTFVIGEVRWEPQSCYETNTLWSEYKNYVQNLSGLFSFSKL